MCFVVSYCTIVGTLAGTVIMIFIAKFWIYEPLGDHTPLIGTAIGAAAGFIIGLIIQSLNEIRAKTDKEG